MKILKRVGLLFLFVVIGAVIFPMVAYADARGAFITWQSLGKPPETPVEVIQPGYIKTASGQIYQQNCNSGCWEKIDAAPADTQENLKLSLCGEVLPPLDDYITSKVVCHRSGIGTSLTIYAIGKDGFVYFWGHSNDEGTGLMLGLSPFIGAAAGFVVGLIVLAFVLFSDWVAYLEKRAKEKAASITPTGDSHDP